MSPKQVSDKYNLLIHNWQDLEGQTIKTIKQYTIGDKDCPEYILEIIFKSGKIAYIQATDIYVSLSLLKTDDLLSFAERI